MRDILLSVLFQLLGVRGHPWPWQDVCGGLHVGARGRPIDADLALGVAALVIMLGPWMLFTQRDRLALAMREPVPAGP